MAREPAHAMNAKEHPLLAHLVASDAAPDAIPFWGYVGPSSGDDLVALYPSLETVGDSVEFARDDVIEVADVPETTLLFGAKVLWVKKDARVARKRVETLDRAAAQPAFVEIQEGRLRMRLRPASLDADCSTPCAECGSTCTVCISICRYVPPPPPR